ncbi:MAG: ACT domain-containing protein [Planctomycetota bacterium]|nr:ACT domain-containing protein [Planctomycetota bacterium]
MTDWSGPGLTLVVEPGLYSVLRLDPDSSTPDWFQRAHTPGFRAELATPAERTLVLPSPDVPTSFAGPREEGFRGMRVAAVLDFALVGILARLATALAEVGVSLLAFSTFDTDWLLVREADLEVAVGALRRAGYGVESDS